MRIINNPVPKNTPETTLLVISGSDIRNFVVQAIHAIKRVINDQRGFFPMEVERHLMLSRKIHAKNASADVSEVHEQLLPLAKYLGMQRWNVKFSVCLTDWWNGFILKNLQGH